MHPARKRQRQCKLVAASSVEDADDFIAEATTQTGGGLEERQPGGVGAWVTRGGNSAQQERGDGPTGGSMEARHEAMEVCNHEPAMAEAR